MEENPCAIPGTAGVAAPRCDSGGFRLAGDDPMPITQFHHSTPRESNRGTGRRRLGLWPQGSLSVLAAMVLLAAVCRGGVGSPEPISAGPKVVESVEAATGTDEIEVQVVTTALRTPWFTVFPLREPDRLVMDLPGFLWKPGRTAHLPSAHPEVEGVRIGQFSDDPLITRIVFDLTVSAQDLRYRTVSTTESGRLRVQVSDQAEIASAEEWTTPVPAKPRPKEQAAHVAKPGAAAAIVAGSGPEPQAAASAPAPATAAVEKEPLGEPKTSVAPASAAASAPEPVEAGATAESPAPPLTVAQSAGVSPRRHLVWILATVGCLIAVGLLALWLRRRSRTDEGELAAFGEVDREAPAPESGGGAGEQPDVVKCKIIDGYLVLAPEGNGRALSDLPPESRCEAKVRGSVELTVAAARSGADEPKGEAPDGPATQAKTLIGALSDESVAVRKAAAQGLWELAGQGHVDVLLPYLKSEDPRIRLVVAGVLGEAGAAKCAGALAEIAADPDPSVRASVLYAFAQLGDKARDHCDAVRARLSDAEGSVRARAVEALAAMNPKSEEVSGEMLDLTGDGDSSVREAAVSAAFGFVSRGVSGAMIELLADPTRRSQAFELLQQGDEAALRRLLMAARSAPPESGERALETISYVMSRRWTVEDFAGELASSDPEDRLMAVEGLAMVGGDEAAQELARLAKSDSSPQIKKRAAEIVGKWKELAPHAAGTPGGSDGGQSDS